MCNEPSTTPGYDSGAQGQGQAVFEDPRVTHRYQNIPSDYVAIRTDKSFAPTPQATGGVPPPYDPTNTGDFIPEEHSTNLWLVNIPVGTEAKDILAQIRGYGRVWAFHLLKPTGKKGEENVAASISFFELSATKRFYSDAQTTGFFVGGRRIVVKMNRRKIKGHEYITGTRCVIVEGRPAECNETSLLEYFATKTNFQVDEVRWRRVTETRNKIEVRFVQFHQQAAVAMAAIQQEKPLGIDRAAFGPDPCAYTDVI
ncbi:hypothetical protein JX265_008179 [Neoarthrinium moseri]|uniref:Uncharacterized protein n=1 Tax=Neoarthrinium moseri TaxID=1658444 RepID=A0A9Q0AME2_9PEZI|nr:hypothetical protein JX265_008179 [Neoarthrinium moseri]